MPKGFELQHEVEQFLFREARLADTHEYAKWEALWTDDAIYWVPANGEDTDPEKTMSIIYDNRSRIGLRVKQLLSGKRYTQEPRSNLARVIGNIEIVATEADQVRARANAMIFETSQRGDTIWGTRNEYVLRRVGGDWRLTYKKVVLANNERAIPTMSFIV